MRTLVPTTVCALLSLPLCGPASAAEPKAQPSTRPVEVVAKGHPSLIITPADLPVLKEKAKVNPRLYRLAITTANARFNSRLSGENQRRQQKDQERAWIDFRSQSTDLIPLSFAYLMTGERKYADSARQLMMDYVGYQTWGATNAKGEIEIDLTAAQTLGSLALGYDWCYDALGEPDRQAVRQAMLKYARLLALDSTGQERTGYVYPWWWNHEFQNHGWVNYSGLGMACLAMMDEEPEAGTLIAPAVKFYRGLYGKLGPDGAWHEGAGYWAFGLMAGLMYIDSLKTKCGESLYDAAWLRNTSAWRIYMDVPDFDRNCLQFDDGPEDHGAWMAPYYLLRRLGAQFRDGYAYALCDREEKAIDSHRKGDGHSYGALAFVWYDPSVTPKALSELPRRKQFTDGGYAVFRTGWEKDATVMGFRCGPQGGWALVNSGKMQYRYSIGHTHADNNGFDLFAHGDFQALDAGGYGYNDTLYYNSLLFDGAGQTKYYGNWELFKKRCGKILDFQAGEGYGYVLGEAAGAYPEAIGVRKFQRHLVSLEEQAFVILDDVKTATPRRASFCLNTPKLPQVAQDGTITADAQGGRLVVKVLEPAGYNYHLRTFSKWGQVQISPKDRGTEAALLTVLLPLGNDQAVPKVTKVASGDWLGARVTIAGRARDAAFRKADGVHKFVPGGFPPEVAKGAAAPEAEAPTPLPARVLVRFRLDGLESLDRSLKPGKLDKQPKGNIQLTDEKPAEGAKAVRMEYYLNRGEGASLEGELPLPGQPRKLSLAVREETQAAGKVISIVVRSADGQQRCGTIHLEQTRPSGWVDMETVLGLGEAAPAWTLTRISIAAGAKDTHGQLCLDNLRLTTSVEAQEVETLRKLYPDLEVLGMDR
jgi:hypothetical protein